MDANKRINTIPGEGKGQLYITILIFLNFMCIYIKRRLATLRLDFDYSLSFAVPCLGSLHFADVRTDVLIRLSDFLLERR